MGAGYCCSGVSVNALQGCCNAQDNNSTALQAGDIVVSTRQRKRL